MDGSAKASQSPTKAGQGDRGHLLAEISNRVVALHKEYYGKGPTKAKTYYQGDLLVVLLRGGFTKVEETLRDAGRGGDVIEQRMAFQEVMRERYSELVERLTGREVVGFMSGSQQNPDLIAEVFVLAPADEAPLGDSAGGESILAGGEPD